MVRSSSEPDMMKNSMNSGAVHLSIISIIAPLSLLILTYITPIAIHVSKSESWKPSPKTLLKPTPAKTATTQSDMRFALDLNTFAANASAVPINPPMPSDAMISSKGMTRTSITLMVFVPSAKVFASSSDMANTIRPIASSNATTGRSVSVTIPRALYCLTTIRVAAGAVAVAIAPRHIAVEMCSTPQNESPMSARSTSRAVNNA